MALEPALGEKVQLWNQGISHTSTQEAVSLHQLTN